MIHIQIWSGTGSMRIVDMANASKRGKTCNAFCVRGEQPRWVSEDRTEQRAAMHYTRAIRLLVGGDEARGVREVKYEELLAQVQGLVAQARADGVNENWLSIHLETVRGIDAPKPRLEFSNDKFSACADEEGIHLSDLVDQNNLPAMCTFKQSGAKAYDIAAKVWDKVKTAKSMYDAGSILSGAGARLHSWCRMD